jgi:hypothetical protein
METQTRLDGVLQRQKRNHCARICDNNRSVASFFMGSDTLFRNFGDMDIVLQIIMRMMRTEIPQKLIIKNDFQTSLIHFLVPASRV